jgi:cell division topological specificity factor
MSLLDYFFTKKQPSATVAKERLQILLAHERAGRSGPDFLPLLQRELIAVVRKYVEISDEMIKIKLDNERQGTSLLEINVEFEPAKARAVAAA